MHALARVHALRDAARAALPALHALAAAADCDVWGRYRLEPGQALDGEDLADWVRLAQHEYTGQPLEIMVVVPVGGQGNQQHP